ncbi:MAG: penicillin-binding protein 2 [Candidatus Pacebacteria bacterium]|nr:penicillin-binding protein 2 [Candidatus Paceibacterota bacterium]
MFFKQKKIHPHAKILYSDSRVMLFGLFKHSFASLRFRRSSVGVKRFGKEIEIEEIFLDKLAKHREEETDTANIKLEVPLKRANFLVLMTLVFLAFLFFFSFVFYFQVVKGKDYSAQAQKNNSLVAHFSAERGIIYDRNMNQLVQNEATFDLYLNVDKLSSTTTIDSALENIYTLLGWSAEKENLDFSVGNALIKENLSQMDLVLLETKKSQMPYLEIKKHIVRHYEANACLGHILGYLGKISQDEYGSLGEGYDFSDYIGRAGVEKTYENVLKEKKGAIQIERDALGNELSQEVISQPSSGDHLVLSLDLALQQKAVTALTQTLEDIGGTKGVVIALNPQNGEVLALVSMPCFDNNLFSFGISQDDLDKLNSNKSKPLLNRATSGLYPTGSTIKPFMASAGLEEGIITPKTTLFCPSTLCVENQYNKDEATCFPDNKFHGWTNVKRAIAESVNPFFYMVGGGYQSPGPNSKFYVPNMPKNFVGLGIARVKEYLNLFGFGAQTGIDLPSEAEGRVPDPEWKQSYFTTALEQKWYLGDTYNLSIGQGYLLATPLQLAVGYASIANGGKLIQPHLAKSFLNSQTNQATDFVSNITRENFISSSTLEVVREGMRQTVTSPAGNAYSLNSLPVDVAAKTGTAQSYGKAEIYNNWIGAFAPYENSEILLVVMVEEVPGLRGSAQQTAKSILGWYFSPKKTEPTKQTNLEPAPISTDVDFPVEVPQQTPTESATTSLDQ